MPFVRALEPKRVAFGQVAQPPRRDALSRNLCLVGVLAGSLVFAASYEGYFGIITLPFWGVLLGGVAMSAWLAVSASTATMLALVLAVFAIEYVKEALGIRYGFWVYHGTNGAFLLGIWAWVLGGITCYVGATRLVAPGLHRLVPHRSGRIVNPLVLLLLAVIGMVLLRDRFHGLGWLYWIFYGALLLFAEVRSRKIDLSMFVSLVLVSWVVGNISEYAGSVGSGVWTFPGHPNYPPVFLLFACWPIEVVAQYALACVFVPETANEP